MAKKGRGSGPRPGRGAKARARTSGGVKAYLRTVYVVLATIVVLAVIAEILYRDVELVDRFAPNIATESIGILLVVIFVQRYLERQERAQRLRGSIGGLRKASRALQRIAATWADMIKGTLPREPETPPREVLELFESHYTEELAHCDPVLRRVATAGDDDRAWVQWASTEVAGACALLNQIIIAYSGSLDPAYVEAIDELVDDDFVRLFSRIASEVVDPRSWTVSMNGERALRESHFARLAAAIVLHNDLARDAAAVRTRRMGPRTGTIGMELPLDHDLRVDVELTRRWWQEQPVQGALRHRGGSGRVRA